MTSFSNIVSQLATKLCRRPHLVTARFVTLATATLLILAADNSANAQTVINGTNYTGTSGANSSFNGFFVTDGSNGGNGYEWSSGSPVVNTGTFTGGKGGDGGTGISGNPNTSGFGLPGSNGAVGGTGLLVTSGTVRINAGTFVGGNGGSGGTGGDGQSSTSTSGRSGGGGGLSNKGGRGLSVFGGTVDIFGGSFQSGASGNGGSGGRGGSGANNFFGTRARGGDGGSGANGADASDALRISGTATTVNLFGGTFSAGSFGNGGSGGSGGFGGTGSGTPGTGGANGITTPVVSVADGAKLFVFADNGSFSFTNGIVSGTFSGTPFSFSAQVSGSGSQIAAATVVPEVNTLALILPAFAILSAVVSHRKRKEQRTLPTFA